MMLIAIHVILKAFVRSAIMGLALLLEYVLNVQSIVLNVQLMLVFAHSVKLVSPLSIMSVCSVLLAVLNVIQLI